MNNLISRQVAIDAILRLTTFTNVRELHEFVQEHDLTGMWCGGINDAIDAVIAVPSAQPEIAIPLSWIEKHIEWLKSMDNAFSDLTAMNISVMVKKWKEEKERKTNG